MKISQSVHITFGILGFIGIIILSNILVYDALVQLSIFNLPAFAIKILLIFLSFGFIFAVLFGKSHYNLFSRAIFIITSIWFGFFVYFSFASIIYLLIFVSSNRENILLGEILIALPIILGIYGIFNAKKIVVRKLNIKLPNLPISWNGKKAVWISDVHLGLVYGKKHMEKIVEKINELHPDIVFIGGDLFDAISVPSVLETAKPLSEIKASMGTYYISGNHEHYGNFNAFMEKIESLRIKILKNEIIKIDGMQIIGIEYSKKNIKHYYRKLLEDLDINEEMPSILLRHEPRDLKIAEQAGVNFQISGHTHNAQQWPLNYYAKLIYKKFTYGLKLHGKMQVYTSSGAGTWGPAIRVGSNNEIVEFTFI